MFRIKKEQMDFFADKARAKFCRKMAAYLRSDFGDRVAALDGEALDAWVAAAVAKADRYKITTEPEAAQLMLLFLLLGLDADQTLPWFEATLRNKNLYAIGKVRKLIRTAREQGVAGLDDVLVYPDMSDRPVELEALEA